MPGRSASSRSFGIKHGSGETEPARRSLEQPPLAVIDLAVGARDRGEMIEDLALALLVKLGEHLGGLCVGGLVAELVEIFENVGQLVAVLDDRVGQGEQAIGTLARGRGGPAVLEGRLRRRTAGTLD